MTIAESLSRFIPWMQTRRQALAHPHLQTKPDDLGCEFHGMLLLFTSTVVIYYYYSARKMIFHRPAEGETERPSRLRRCIRAVYHTGGSVA